MKNKLEGVIGKNTDCGPTFENFDFKNTEKTNTTLISFDVVIGIEATTDKLIECDKSYKGDLTRSSFFPNLITPFSTSCQLNNQTMFTSIYLIFIIKYFS